MTQGCYSDGNSSGCPVSPGCCDSRTIALFHLVIAQTCTFWFYSTLPSSVGRSTTCLNAQVVIGIRYQILSHTDSLRDPHLATPLCSDTYSIFDSGLHTAGVRNRRVDCGTAARTMDPHVACFSSLPVQLASYTGHLQLKS